MIFLDASTKLELILSGAVATNQSEWQASYADSMSTASPVAKIATGTTNSGTAVTIVDGGGAGITAPVGIKSFMLNNKDTAAITITIRTNNGGTTRNIAIFTLAVGDNCGYEDNLGWYVLDSSGNLRAAPTINGARSVAPTVITSGTTVTTGATTKNVFSTLYGGGGGGGGTTSSASNAAAGGGGSAGSKCIVWAAVAPSTTYTIAIGAGGNAGSSSGGNGGSGGSTTLAIGGTTYTSGAAAGGTGMAFGTSANTVAGGTSGAAANGFVNSRGMPGFPGVRLSGTVSCSGNGGSTDIGGGGLGSNADNTAGAAGNNYGGGGAGGNTLGGGAVTGGAGAGGCIIWEEYS